MEQTFDYTNAPTDTFLRRNGSDDLVIIPASEAGRNRKCIMFYANQTTAIYPVTILGGEELTIANVDVKVS